MLRTCKTCCRTAMTGDATRTKVLADKANERHCQKMATLAKKALAEVQRHHDAAECAAALPLTALADEQHCHEETARTQALANKQQRHGASEAKAMMGAFMTLSLIAKTMSPPTATGSANPADPFMQRIINKISAVVADCIVALNMKEFANRKEAADRRTGICHCHFGHAGVCQEQAVPGGCCHGTAPAATEHVPMLVNPTLSNVAIKCIWMVYAQCAAPLDAILAEITCKKTAHNDLAMLMTPSVHPATVSPSLPCPTSYVGAVLATMGRSPDLSFLVALAPLALPSPSIDGQLLAVCQCTQSCHCTGQCNCP
jgi:hypothetical protein